MVARALAQKPQALILDEPVTYLDPKARVELLLTLRRICRQRKIAVIASLHEIELALRVADRLLVVAAGRVKAYGSPEEFVEDGGPVELYEFGEDAGFCAETLTVETRPQPSEGFKVFIIAGAGRGAPVYRMLARLNTPFATGVLHEGDLDYYVAKSLGGEVIAEKAFHQISLEKLEQALTTASKADAAIYVSHPVGLINAANTALAEKLAEKGIPTIVYGDAAVKGCWAKVERLRELADILKQVSRKEAVTAKSRRHTSSKQVNNSSSPATFQQRAYHVNILSQHFLLITFVSQITVEMHHLVISRILNFIIV
jgi:iron complex transport system ATP-binding protein